MAHGSRRCVVVRVMLPASARRKIADIEQAIADRQALTRSTVAAVDEAQRHLGDLMTRRGASPSDALDAEIVEAEADIERLRGIQIERQARVANDRQVIAQLRGWLGNVGSTPLSVAPPVRMKLGKGEGVAAAVERIRGEIAALKDELSALQRAPLPAAELKQRAKALVDELAARGRPVINTDRGQFDVQFRREGATVPGMTPHDTAALLAWLNPQALLKRLEDEIGDAKGIGTAERERRTIETRARIIDLERMEEALIEQAPDIARRTDASPSAILGVQLLADVKAA